VNLSDEQKNECKRLFDSYQEIMDRAKELTAEKGAIVDHFARICEIKKGTAGKILKAIAKKIEGEEPDEEIVVECIGLLES
jgi:uncharacterized protein (DUF111 family)